MNPIFFFVGIPIGALLGLVATKLEKKYKDCKKEPATSQGAPKKVTTSPWERYCQTGQLLPHRPQRLSTFNLTSCQAMRVLFVRLCCLPFAVFALIVILADISL